VIIGQPKQQKLLSIKKVTNFRAQKEVNTKLNFVVKQDDENDKELKFKVYLVCDSYVGCDQEDDLTIKLE